MGILNVTPDSFSDGGMHLDIGDAVRAGTAMFADGADLIDVGGESTRPGAEPVSEEEELRRVVPVIKAFAASGIPTSVDTRKSKVAEAAIRSGAGVVNDISGLRDPHMRRVCAESYVGVCIMHMQGEPRTMQENPSYSDVVAEVRESLVAWAGEAEASGIGRDRIWIDPGIGFGKRIEHNLALLNNLEVLVDTGYPVLVGVSRKAFIGRLLGRDEPLPVGERLIGTIAAQVVAQMKGAKVIRAHDVKEARQAVEMTRALTHQEIGSGDG